MSVNSVMLFIDMLAGLSTSPEDSQESTFDGNIACVVLTTQHE